MEARLEAETTEVAQLAAKQVMAELQSWIEQERPPKIQTISPPGLEQSVASYVCGGRNKIGGGVELFLT
jgi:hypothetical protein